MSLPEPLRRRLGSFSRTIFTDSRRAGPQYPSERAGKRGRLPAIKMAAGAAGAGERSPSRNQDGGANGHLVAVRAGRAVV